MLGLGLVLCSGFGLGLRTQVLEFRKGSQGVGEWRNIGEAIASAEKGLQLGLGFI